MLRLVGVVIALSLAAPLQAAPTAELAISRLRWDARENPLGLIQFEPRLSWVVTGGARGERQSAYQVLVASTPDRLLPGKADVWDSGKVVSSDAINVRYGGPSPQARQRAYWTVRVWDRADRPTAFAPPAWWEMGLFDEEWEGQWIGRPRQPNEAARDRSAVLLRKPFTLSDRPVRARLYITAFGAYEARLNGQRIGDAVLSPGYTDYEKRVLFQAYDVTRHLRSGENVLGALVGGTWCTAGTPERAGACGAEPPRVMAQLEVSTADGKSLTVMTDQSWRTHPGPIVSAHLHEGETYDARRELPGWDAPGFDDEGWTAVQQYDKKIERDIAADSGPPLKIAEDLKPLRITTPKPGVHLLDFGRTITGWTRINLRAPAGTTISLRHLAIADAAGGPLDRYITRGGGVETWEPRFTLHRFRFVEVSGLPRRPASGTFTARVIHSSLPLTGSLQTSSSGLNRLIASIDARQRAAFVSVPMLGADGLQRPGAMLDARAFALTGCLNRDVWTFYRKWVDDMRDAQQADAAYAETSPGAGARPGGPGAGTAGVLVPQALFRCYADRTALHAHMTSMGRFVDAIQTANPQRLWTNALGANLGDPLERGAGTDKGLIATAEWIAAADALTEIARDGGAPLASYTQKYGKLAQEVRGAFAARFVGPDGKLTSDTQTAYALAIGLGLLPEAARQRAGRHLLAALARDGQVLGTGLLATPYLLSALSSLGQDDVAYRLLLQASAQAPETSHALDGAGAWLYDAAGGIALDPSAPAGQHVFIHPRPGGDVTWARARYDSAHGPIATEWRRQGKTFRLKVSLPPNSRATVTLPAGVVTEAGKPIAGVPGVQLLPASDGRVHLSLASGSYDLRVAAR